LGKDAGKITPDIAKTKFSILNSFYFSDKDYSQLYNSISPVNSFRVIFNKYFNTNLPILEDKRYYYKDYKFIFDTYEYNEN